MQGVPVTDLHCPTCSTKYDLPLTIYREQEDVSAFLRTERTYVFKTTTPWYVVCPNNHCWSVSNFIRNGPDVADEILLGRYIGT